MTDAIRAAVAQVRTLSARARTRMANSPGFARLTGGILAVIAALLFASSWLSLMGLALRPSSLWSGIALLLVLLSLTLFNARKKLPFLPLFRAAAWMRFHTYAGWFVVCLFLLHLQFHMPRGGMGMLLTTLFVGAALSGVIGLGLTWRLPRRLAQHGEQVIFERIPALRDQLRTRAEQLIVGSVAQTHSTTLADYYTANLEGYFGRPHSLWSHMYGSSRALHRRLADLAALDRYLSSEEREVAALLQQCIRAKDNLDHSRACQGLLKGWLFVHIPLSYSLLLTASLHGAVAWLFMRGGA